jgi:hypothetical protein
MKEKGPFGQFLRLRRNCAKETDYTKHADKMFDDYSKRGNPQKIIQPQKDRASIIDRKIIFQPKMPKLKSEKIPLILNYNPMNPPIMRSILKCWEIAQTSEKGSTIFKEKPILAHRRCPNLRDLAYEGEISTNKRSYYDKRQFYSRKNYL